MQKSKPKRNYGKKRKMNSKEKSLRWIVNQIPDFVPETDEEKMLLTIKTYCSAGAEEIKYLETENAILQKRLENVMEIPCKVGDTIYWVVRREEKTYLEEGKVVSFALCEDGFWIYCRYKSGLYWYTKEEFCKETTTDIALAQTRLIELKEKNNK